MKKVLFILIFAALMAASIMPKSVQAQEEKLVMAGYSGILKSADIQPDMRVQKLEAFLQNEGLRVERLRGFHSFVELSVGSTEELTVIHGQM